MEEQFGNACARSQNVNNRTRIRKRPVQCNRDETNDDTSARSACRSVGNLPADEPHLKVGTLLPTVDTPKTAQYQTTHLNGYLMSEDCQDAAFNVQNAEGKVELPKTTGVRILADGDNNPISDGTIHDYSNRTITRSNDVACVSNSSVDETSPVTTAGNDVSVSAFENRDLNGDGQASGGDARNNNFLTPRYAIEYRARQSSAVNGTSLPAAEYNRKSADDDIDGRNSAFGDGRNENRLLVPRSECAGALAKAGDFDREREIERRMRELGLWECKRDQERHLAELLDAQISRRDGLTAALRRCRRRQRGEAAAAAEDIRCHVNQHIVRYVSLLLTGARG